MSKDGSEAFYMPIIKLSTVDLYYELHGPTGAPPLLLIHGALETFQSSWRKQIAGLSRQYRLIGPDLRGHGQSNNPARQLDLRQMADDLAELLTYLGYDRAHVAGFSGGSSTALFLAYRHPARLTSLTLVSNNFELDQIRNGSGQFWNPERLAREEPEWWARTGKLHQTSLTELLNWWAEEDKVRPNFRPEELATVNVPTLVMGGDRDPIVPLEQTLGLFYHLPNSRLCILPNVGHGLPRRYPELFNQILLDFISGLE